MTLIAPLNVPQPVKLRIEDYELLLRAGTFSHLAKTELIEGVIVEMNSQYRRHSFAKNELTYRLRRALEALGSSYSAQSETTVAMPPHAAPEPDIVVTSAPQGDGYVPLESVALLVEVSDSTISFDLGTKAEMYAAHGVPEYWVVDLPAAQIHQLWQPLGNRFQRSRSHSVGDVLQSAVIAELRIETRGIL